MYVVVCAALLLMIPVAVQLIQVSRAQTGLQSHFSVQADNIARAGLADAVSWFRRQSHQPVCEAYNPNTNPVTSYDYPDAAFFPQQGSTDTLDAGIGLVQEYSLDSALNLRARYEVKRQRYPPVPVDPDAVHDITALRLPGGKPGDGLAWYIESLGFVYRKRDAGNTYNSKTDVILGRARASTEIRRLNMNLPAKAALIVTNISSVTLSSCAVMGETSIGIAYQYQSGQLPNNLASTVSGSARTQQYGNALSIVNVSSCTERELKLLADYAVSGVAQLPADRLSMAIVFIDGDAVFTSTTSDLSGGGFLYVRGNLFVNPAASATFSGIIYVTGDATVRGPATISGMLACRGGVKLGDNNSLAKVDYKSTVINSVSNLFTQYIENKGNYYAFSGTKR